MTGPQYINDLSSLYTRMYNHPGRERPLEENFEPSNKPNVEVVEDEEPNWKKLIRGMPKKQKRHMSPTIADVPRDNIPDAHEEEENQDVGVGSDIMGTYLDALEKKKPLLRVSMQHNSMLWTKMKMMVHLHSHLKLEKTIEENYYLYGSTHKR